MGVVGVVGVDVGWIGKVCVCCILCVVWCRCLRLVMYRIGRCGCRYWWDGGGDGDCDEGSDGKVGRFLLMGRGGVSVM